MSTQPASNPPEERSRGSKIVSDVPWRCWRSKVGLAEFTCPALKVRIIIWGAINPKVGNAGSIMEGLGDLLQADRAILWKCLPYET